MHVLCLRWDAFPTTKVCVSANAFLLHVIQLHQTSLEAQRNCFAAGGNTQLAEDISHVGLDGLLGNRKFFGHLSVAESTSQAVQYFQLAGRQIRVAAGLVEPATHRWG